MVDLNEVHMTGRLVRDIELRSNSKGSPYVWFSLAVNGKKDKEGNTPADFLTCQLWGKPAELLAKFGKKGTRLLISKGVLKSFSSEDDTGVRRTYTYVLINGYEFLDGLGKQKEGSFFDNFGEEINF